MCAALPTARDAIQCYDDSVTAGRDHHRAEQDLDAQREMADWAEGMLWATLIIGVFTIFVTALGAFWVKKTLDVTRAAVKAADDAVEVTRAVGNAQIRPYLSVDGFIAPHASVMLGGSTVEFTFKNHGVTPANLTYVDAVSFVDSFATPETVEVPETGWCRLGNGGLVHGGEAALNMRVTTGNLEQSTIDKIVISKDFRLYCAVRLSYTDLLGNEYFEQSCVSFNYADQSGLRSEFVGPNCFSTQTINTKPQGQ